MKYGEALHERSVPQWALHNIDYNELKQLIKTATTQHQAQALAMPGQPNDALRQFEDLFCQELFNQHERVDLFVKSKADEFRRRLRNYDQKATRLIARCDPEVSGTMTLRRRERLSKLETRVMRCGEEIRNLDRFVQAQQIGFRKILRKYKRWTDSTTLTPRTDQFLQKPTSFLKLDFEPLYAHYTASIERIREHSPSQSESSTALTESRRGSHSRAVTLTTRKQVAVQTSYWNEYDNPSEGEENEPYAIYLDAYKEYSFPGRTTMSHALTYLSDKAAPPMAKLRRWINPHAAAAAAAAASAERRPLLSSTNPHDTTTATTSGAEDNDLCDFREGYAPHYTTFPSVASQSLSLRCEALLFHCTLGCFVASTTLLLISGLLLLAGRNRLRKEVDVGVITGNITGLVFASLGFNVMLCRWARVGWVQRVLVGGAFVGSCLVGGAELVILMRHS